MPLDGFTPLEAATRQLRERGVILKPAPGGFTVNVRGGSPAAEHWTDNLSDALAYGLALDAPAPELPPLGPMGKGRPSQRAKMYAHNRKVAARRRKQKDSSKSE